MVPYESTLERDLLRTLAYDRHVLDVEAQPLTLTWTAPSGRKWPYTPDFLAERRQDGSNTSWLIEVKPRSDLQKHWVRWHPKFRIAARYAAARGWRFRILDESRIRNQIFRNVATLDRYRAQRPPIGGDTNAIINDLTTSRIRTFGALLDQHFGREQSRKIGMQAILHLLAVRVLDCDLSKPLDDHLELWIPTNHDD